MSIAAVRASVLRWFAPYTCRSIAKGQLNKKQLSHIFTMVGNSQNRSYSTISYLPGEKGDEMDQKLSAAYKGLCTEYYELDKPQAPPDALSYYLKKAEEARGPILEPMCGTGRFLIPLLKKGYNVTGFDSSHHMLNVCRKKCQNEGLNANLLKGSFENFSSTHNYQLIFIPSGSFCLLTKPDQVTMALNKVNQYLDNKGKFIFEIDTPTSVIKSKNVWRGSWVERSDGSKIVQSWMTNFNSNTRIQSSLHRYDVWEKNSIIKTEVEEFHLRLYTTSEIENYLTDHGFEIINKSIPYKRSIPNKKAEYVLYECAKKLK